MEEIHSILGDLRKDSPFLDAVEVISRAIIERLNEKIDHALIQAPREKSSTYTPRSKKYIRRAKGA